MYNEMKKEFTLWIIIALIIGLFIIFMPDIERLLFGRAKKDKAPVTEEKEVEKKETVKTGSFKCGTTLNDESVEYVIYHEDNKVVREKITSTTIFDTQDEITALVVENCNTVEEKYNTQKGFKATCQISGLRMMKEYNIDLKTYEGFTITNTDGTEEVFQKDLTYQQNVESVLEYYAKNGASCQ